MNKFHVYFFLVSVLVGSVFPYRAFSQGKGGDSALVFKVRNPALLVKIIPDDSVLYIGQKNPITIRMIGGNHTIGMVTLEGGNLKGKDSSWIARVGKGKTAMLSVYEKMNDNSLRICFTKMYTIMKNPDPVVTVCGIPTDSFADKLDIIYGNKIEAFWDKKSLEVPVLSFDMIFLNDDGNPDTLHSYDEKFTIDMKNRIRLMREGSIITIDQVICLMPDGRKKKLDPASIFIARTNKYNVGFREF